jgi:pimeloyl-ACP methyl ester carboxylesterase
MKTKPLTVRPGLTALLCAMVMLIAGCTFFTRPEPPAPAAPLPPVIKNEMRQPWTPPGPPYLRQWLVLGVFPFQPGSNAGSGLATDYLKDAGGEAAATPTAGQAVKQPDGTAAAWTEWKSPTDTVDLVHAFQGRKAENVVGYAYTTVNWTGSEQAVMAVGSDDGVAVWLNGAPVHRNPVWRGFRPDSDIVPVTMKAGENRILVKVEQGGGEWKFSLRVLTADQAAMALSDDLDPAVMPPPDTGDSDMHLKVRTDRQRIGSAARPAVKVEVIAPGGRPVAEKDGPRGQVLDFDPAGWPDGPYEIRCSSKSAQGRTLAANLPWYKGDWRAAASRLVGAAAKADPKTPDGMTLGMLSEMIRDRMGKDLDRPGTVLAQVYPALMEAAELDIAKAGAPGPLHGYGFVRLAWRDPVDDSPQFCRAYLPPDYDPASSRRWPMVVSLHGYHPENPLLWRWAETDRRHTVWPDRYGVIFIEPHGRGNTGYRGFGEADVLRAIEEARKKFSVDNDRVYLMGYSMGGDGAWNIGSRHPELFAAMAPVYGGWDYHATMGDAEAAALTPWQRFSEERWSSFVQAESLLHMPILVTHGDADDTVPVEGSRYAVRMLQRWGYDIRYHEYPGVGHGATGWCEDEIIPWLLDHKRTADPKHVRLRSPELTGASAYWLRVTQCDNPRQMIVADAEIVNPTTVRLDTENALEVTLQMQADPTQPSTQVKVIWNGKAYGTTIVPKNGTIVLRDEQYKRVAGEKTPEVCGPISAAMDTPFVIVQGTTSKDPLMRRLCEKQALALAREYEEWQHVRPRFYKDTEIPDSMLTEYSLILIGGPDDNRVTGSLQACYGIMMNADSVTLDKRTFPAKDAAVALIRPNPLNPKRYVVVRAGTSAKGMFWADQLPDDVDFVIADGRVVPPGVIRPPEDMRVATGVFDKSWQVRDDLLVLGSDAARLVCMQRKTPTLVSAATKESRLYLADLMESAAQGSFANMRRDVNWQFGPISFGGKKFERGIAVQIRREENGADYDIAGAGWRRLRATLGLEFDDVSKLEPRHKEFTQVVYTVRGDGKVLYQSPAMRWDSKPLDIDVDVSGAKTLRLEVRNESMWNYYYGTSVDWADLRLEK